MGKTVRVYINDIFYMTMPEVRIEGLLLTLRSKGITNVTIR
jgi:hypothetical protein